MPVSQPWIHKPRLPVWQASAPPSALETSAKDLEETDERHGYYRAMICFLSAFSQDEGSVADDGVRCLRDDASTLPRVNPPLSRPAVARI